MSRKFFRFLVIFFVAVMVTGAGIILYPNSVHGKGLSQKSLQITSGISVLNETAYTGYEIKIVRSRLPEWAQGYTQMRLQNSSASRAVISPNIHSYDENPLLLYKEDTSEILRVGNKVQPGKWYVLVVLFDDENRFLGYYRASVDVGLLKQAKTGISVERAEDYIGFKAFVNENELPEGMENFSKFSVSMNTVPFAVSQKGLPENVANYAYAHPNNMYATMVPNAGTWHILVVLYDDRKVPLGYYETSVYIETDPTVKVPRIPSGITVENTTEYTGYAVKIARSALPDWAQKYSRIGLAASYMDPFDVPANGLSFGLNSIFSYDESPDGITTIKSTAAASKWYVLVALYDEYNNPVGYFDTSVDVVDPESLPPVPPNK